MKLQIAHVFARGMPYAKDITDTIAMRNRDLLDVGGAKRGWLVARAEAAVAEAMGERFPLLPGSTVYRQEGDARVGWVVAVCGHFADARAAGRPSWWLVGWESGPKGGVNGPGGTVAEPNHRPDPPS